jgi:hypothetical protein
MKHNDKYLTETLDILKREFGQPLLTLQDTIKAHQAKKLQESPGEVKFAKKALSKLVKTEQKFRKQMYDLEQVFLQDPNPTNKKLATEIKKSYRSNTTTFMREIVLMVKRMK